MRTSRRTLRLSDRFHQLSYSWLDHRSQRDLPNAQCWSHIKNVSNKSTHRAHILLPDDLVTQIDALVGPRGRSAFLVETARNELRRRALSRFLEDRSQRGKMKIIPNLRRGRQPGLGDRERKMARPAPVSRENANAHAGLSRHERPDRRTSVAPPALRPVHQTLHAFCRTMGASALQWYASRNSGMLDTTPLIRHFAGECGSTATNMRANSSVRFWHHTLAQPRKNRCLAVKPSLGGGSFPARISMRAIYAMRIPPLSRCFLPELACRLLLDHPLS